MVHMLCRVQEYGVSEPMGMQDLLREDFSIVVEVIDSNSVELT